jgi:hypothetical protein
MDNAGVKAPPEYGEYTLQIYYAHVPLHNLDKPHSDWRIAPQTGSPVFLPPMVVSSRCLVG